MSPASEDGMWEAYKKHWAGRAKMHGGPLGSSISFACLWHNIVHWETENLAIFPLLRPQDLTDH